MNHTTIIKSIVILLLYLITYTNIKAQRIYSINEAWTFSLGELDRDSENIVSFPHSWNANDAMDDTPGFYRGEAWYKKEIHLSSEYNNKIVYLYFEGANQVTDVYVNEQHVGQHKGGYTRFCFDISKYIKIDEENIFTIKVNNAHDPMIPPLSADFTFFGGIYRDVYLDVREPIHLSPTDMASSGVYVSTPVVDANKAVLNIKTLINNLTSDKKNLILEHQVYSPDGQLVNLFTQKERVERESLNQDLSTQINIENPILWSIETPNLYSIKTTIRDSQTKVVLDQSVNTIGIRWFSFDADKGFFLNGKHVKLMGTNRHQCFQNKGNALEDQYHVKDIRLLKEMGGNFLRVSHYPQDPLVLEMCDKLGIVASVEIPIVNTVTESQEFLDNSLEMAEEMVKQNFNHPSLVMWSYMNEVMLRPPYKANDERYKSYCNEVNRQAKAIEETIRQLDPDRYTMVAFHGSVKAYADARLFDVPMIVGWNLYQGWYSGTFDGFDRFLLDYKKEYPYKPTLITEYGADVDTRIHSFKPERFDFSVEYGDAYHEHYLKTILKHDFIAGATIWNLNDFHSEIRTDAVPHINSKGITELNRIPKNTYYLYKAHLTKAPFVKIASTDWTLRAGIETDENKCTQKIKIYSNQNNVTVYHNGTKLADVAMEHCVGEVDIPFIHGINHIEAKIADANISDIYNPWFDIVSQTINSNFKELNVNLGTNRYFEEKDGAIIWIPEQEYRPGSWGYVGGEAYRPKTNFGSLPAADINILGTDLDPLFQTQRVGLESFKADLPNGKYAVYFYWADLNKKDKGEILAYNLGNDIIHNDVEKRIFDVFINSQKVLKGYDIPNQIGLERAIVKKVLVDVIDNNGLTIDFKTVEGKTILNAIRIFKIN